MPPKQTEKYHVCRGRVFQQTRLFTTVMTSDWPKGLDQFGEFLLQQGLSFERRGVVPSTGDKLWQYGTSTIGVRVLAEKGTNWTVWIADIAGWPQQWYPSRYVREFLTGRVDDDWPHSNVNNGIDEQMRFVEDQWTAIVESFRDDKREETHGKLKALGEQQNRRYFGL